MKTFLLSFLFCVIYSTSTYSQTILVGGKPSTGILSWDDFTGRVDKSSSFKAFTSYKYNTKWNKVSYQGESVIIEGFDVILELDSKNTWAIKDKTSDELLVHEQGHFNLGILNAREVMKRVKETKFTKSNYTATMQLIINEVSKKYNDMGILYDQETDHSKNKEQQAKWNKFFKEQLAL